MKSCDDCCGGDNANVKREDAHQSIEDECE